MSISFQSRKFLAFSEAEIFNFSDPPSVQYLLHLAFPAFRVLLLFPLVAALTNPRISYQPVANGDEEIPSDSSLLLPAGEHATPSRGLAPLSAEASKYGTFRTGRPLIPTASGPTTRTPTPTPSSVRVPQPKVLVLWSF